MPAPKGNDFAVVADALKKSIRHTVSFTAAENKRLMRSHRGRGKLTRHIELLALAAVAAGIDPHQAA